MPTVFRNPIGCRFTGTQPDLLAQQFRDNALPSATRALPSLLDSSIRQALR
jgi:hypothetical protein